MKRICSFLNCGKKHKGHGYCQGHLRQVTKGYTLTPLRVQDKGQGFKTTQEGYIYLFKPNHPTSTKTGHILEHRYVMECKLGRSLMKHENVHHKNGIRDDNTVENLELWVRPQPTGQRIEDLIDWVVSIYPTEVNKRFENK